MRFLVILLITQVISCTTIQYDIFSAIEANDVTVTLAGCNQDEYLGFLLCRVRENAATSDKVRLKVPTPPCDREKCVEWQIVKPSGSFGDGGATNESIIHLTLKDFLKTDSVKKNDSSEYQVFVRVFYTDNDGMERFTEGRGIVRILVYDEEYEPLVCNSPFVSFVDSEKEKEIHYTTGYRSALCGKR